MALIAELHAQWLTYTRIAEKFEVKAVLTDLGQLW